MSKDIPKGDEIEDAITRHMDRRFLSSLDLAGQGTVKLTIDRVEIVKLLKYENGQKKENAKLCYFAELERPLELNATNIKSLITLLGTNKVKDWHGFKIGLYAKPGMYFGEQGLAVRVDHNCKPEKAE